MAGPSHAGRDAFARRDWTAAAQAFAASPGASADAGDLEALAVASYLIGNDDESAAAWEAAYRRHTADGSPAEAARCAFWLAMSLMMRGQMAPAGGWLGRAAEIVAASAPDCAAAGYLLIPDALGALGGGDASAAHDIAVRVGELARQSGDRDLAAFAALGQGQALIAMGDAAAGTARLDEAMVAVTAGEVGPITSGIVYCAVILECMQLLDLSRAAEWTEALRIWCDAQPDLVPYRGQCLVHRSQLEQAAGDWSDAASTAEAACLRLSDPPHPALGLAQYQRGELHRLAGRFDEAEDGYRAANRCGHQPMPGLALLELERGDADSAAATIGRALAEAGAGRSRPAVLAAAVEIYTSTGRSAPARDAADELVGLARTSTSEVLQAMAAQAIGAVLFHEGGPAASLTHLRAASAAWQHLQMPHERARTAVLLGRACLALGDRSSALLEFDAARDAFAALGAVPDLRRLALIAPGPDGAGRPDAGRRPLALSPREREVLAHLAAGRTNREIAASLVISRHTVGRHLENIYAKLGVTTRAAATAAAYEHDLL